MQVTSKMCKELRWHANLSVICAWESEQPFTSCCSASNHSSSVRPLVLKERAFVEQLFGDGCLGSE